MRPRTLPKGIFASSASGTSVAWRCAPAVLEVSKAPANMVAARYRGTVMDCSLQPSLFLGAGFDADVIVGFAGRARIVLHAAAAVIAALLAGRRRRSLGRSIHGADADQNEYRDIQAAHVNPFE